LKLQANEDADKPGLVAILQKVLQLYAAGVLSKRSYAAKGMTVDKAEELLETVISGICDCTLQSRSLISLNVISFRGFSEAGFRQCLNMQQTKWPNSS
jgi:hypothetical protein